MLAGSVVGGMVHASWMTPRRCGTVLQSFASLHDTRAVEVVDPSPSTPNAVGPRFGCHARWVFKSKCISFVFVGFIAPQLGQHTGLQRGLYIHRRASGTHTQTHTHNTGIVWIPRISTSMRTSLLGVAVLASASAAGTAQDITHEDVASADPQALIDILDQWNLKGPLEPCFVQQSFDGDTLVHSSRDLIQGACPEVPLVQWDRLWRRLTPLGIVEGKPTTARVDADASVSSNRVLSSAGASDGPLQGYSGVSINTNQSAVMFGKGRAVYRDDEGLRVMAPKLHVDGSVTWDGSSPLDANVTAHSDRLAALESNSPCSSGAAFRCEDPSIVDDETVTAPAGSMPGYDGFVVTSNKSYIALGEKADVKLLRVGGSSASRPPQAYLTTSLTVNGDLEIEGDLLVEGVSLSYLKDLVLELINCTSCHDLDSDGVLGVSYPRTCLEILEADFSSDSGTYTIQPDLTMNPFKAYCDMDRDGGGWTRLITVDASTSVRSEFWEDFPSTFDYSEAYEPLSSGMYKGSLDVFDQVREFVACSWSSNAESCAMKVYGDRSTMETAASGFGTISSSKDMFTEVREFYGYDYGTTNSYTYSHVPPCVLSYDDIEDSDSYIEGCCKSTYTSSTRTDTVLGWAVDTTGMSWMTVPVA